MVMNQSGSVHQTSSRTGQWFAWFAVIGMIVGLTAFFQVLTKSSNGITQVVLRSELGDVVDPAIIDRSINMNFVVTPFCFQPAFFVNTYLFEPLF